MAGKKALQAITLKKLGLAGGGATLRLGYQQQPSSLLPTEKGEKQAPTLGIPGSLYQPRQDFEGEKPSGDEKKQPFLATTSVTMMEKTLHMEDMEEGNTAPNQQEAMETAKEAMESNLEAMESSEEAMETSEGGVSLITPLSDAPQFPVLPFSIFPEEVQLPSQDRLTEPTDSQGPPPLFVNTKGRRAIVIL